MILPKRSDGKAETYLSPFERADPPKTVTAKDLTPRTKKKLDDMKFAKEQQ